MHGETAITLIQILEKTISPGEQQFSFFTSMALSSERQRTVIANHDLEHSY